MKKTIVIFFQLGIFLCFFNLQTLKVFALSANTAGYDTSRIYKAMAKARRGEPITICVLGGSITAGSLASSTDKRWANLMEKWWANKFPSSTITFVNAGIGGTGSDIGTFRVKSDVIKYNPDFVVVEFAVNDAGETSSYVQEMMEGIIRQLYSDTCKEGVLMLLLQMENLSTAQADHKVVGNYYQVPMISGADQFNALLANGAISSFTSIYGDDTGSNNGVHPNDLGHQYIASFITSELDTIYKHLPADNLLPSVSLTLPDPLVTDVYSKTYSYTGKSLVPSTNTGWVTSTDWSASTVGQEATFALEGNAIAVEYTRHDLSTRGQAELWIDDGTHQVLDAYWTQTWGPATEFILLGEGLSDGEHTLHVKILDTNSSGSTGHYFQLVKILKAGNLTDEAPIAVAGNFRKLLTGSVLDLDGSESYDPDSTSISYYWSVAGKPDGSVAKITDSLNVTASFIPDVQGNYKIGLVVSDGTLYSVMGIRSIYAREKNAIPIAVPGNDSTVKIGKYVKLNGSNSYDKDGDTLTYAWNIISQPNDGSGSYADYADTVSSLFSFKPWLVGEYKIGLVVNDGYTDSQESVITVTAKATLTDIEQITSERAGFDFYPNPVDKQLFINYGLSEAGEMDISLYSINGQFLLKLKHANQEAGRYHFEFNIDRTILQKGVYVLKFTTPQGQVCKKLIIY
jgi:lysophospholipase L1-like esterase